MTSAGHGYELYIADPDGTGTTRTLIRLALMARNVAGFDSHVRASLGLP